MRSRSKPVGKKIAVSFSLSNSAQDLIFLIILEDHLAKKECLLWMFLTPLSHHKDIILKI
jgi:hypothetical protein